MSETIIEEGKELVGVGTVYKNKETGEEVIPFLTDMSGLVVYAPVGSAREVRTDTAAFMAAFEVSTEAQEQEQKASQEAETQQKEAPTFAGGTAGDEPKPTGDGTSVDGRPTTAETVAKTSTRSRK